MEFFLSKTATIRCLAFHAKPEIEIQTKLSQMLLKRASEGFRRVEGRKPASKAPKGRQRGVELEGGRVGG